MPLCDFLNATYISTTFFIEKRLIVLRDQQLKENSVKWYFDEDFSCARLRAWLWYHKIYWVLIMWFTLDEAYDTKAKINNSIEILDVSYGKELTVSKNMLY